MLNYFNQFELNLSFSFFYFSNLLIILFIFFFINILLFWTKSKIINYYNIFYDTILEIFKVQLSLKKISFLNELRIACSIVILFFLILTMNIIGLFPYIFSPTVHICLTLGLSITIVIGSFILGVKNFKYNYFSVMTPMGSPMLLSPFLVLIETSSFIARIFSLGIRLAANISAGHLMMAIISSFGLKILLSSSIFLNILPFLIIFVVIVLEIAVSIIQAYVFCLLTCIYLSESLNLH